MKKLISLLLITVCSMTVIAQTEISIEEYEAKVQSKREIIIECFEKRDGLTIINLYSEFIALFDRLSKREQETCKDVQCYNYYNIACGYSLINQKDNAIDAFEKAIKAYDFVNYSQANIDTDLDNIRNDERFIALMDIVREKGDYIYILRKAGKYQNADTTGLRHFTYEAATSYNLNNVRKYFNLDSIAGQGDEISKILNLLAWVHDNIRHDGNNDAIAEFDAIDIYHYHKATGKGVNCRQLAITLNEMYLAMGFKSRYVTCGSKDNSEVHVINSVYSTTLNKWLWVDPTCYAYWKDENGNLLSIEEVRKRLIDDHPLFLNEDANWNHEADKTKEIYLDNWMSKLLYWLECPISSSFNVESRYRNTNITYICLAPLDYEVSESSYNKVLTHDADYFWEH